MEYKEIKGDIEDFQKIKGIFDRFKAIKKELGIPDNKLVDIEDMRHNLEKINLIK